jgi:hypothetical protein
MVATSESADHADGVIPTGAVLQAKGGISGQYNVAAKEILRFA